MRAQSQRRGATGEPGRLRLLGLLGLLSAVIIGQPVCEPGPAYAQGAATGPARLRFSVEEGQLVIHHAGTGERLSSVHVQGQPRAFAAAGQALYVACRDRGVALIDLHDPRAPREVTTFASDLVIAQIHVLGDVLQLRTPSGATVVAYRIQATETPVLLGRLQAWDEDSEPEVSPTASPTEAAGRSAAPTWLRLKLRDGSQVTGLPQPGGPAHDLVLRLPNRATLTLPQREILQREPAPVPASELPSEPPSELPLALRSGPQAGARSQEVHASGRDYDPVVVYEHSYVVDGVNFQIRGGESGHRRALGEVRLPWAGQNPPLVHGRAAYVLLPHRGLAVVDIGLSRFPYVIWQLLPQKNLRSARLQGRTLRLILDNGQAEYDVTDPLRPQGLGRYPVAPRRHYPDDDERPQVSDGSWQDQGRLWPVSGRRIYLADDTQVSGRWIRTDADGVTIEILGQPRVIARRDIVHSEPVYLDLEHQQQTAATASPAGTGRSASTAGRVFVVGGAAILAVGQVVGITAACLAFTLVMVGILRPWYWSGYATEPRPVIAPQPGSASLPSFPATETLTVLRVRF